MAAHRALHLPRFAARVLGSMRPSDVGLMSYDMDSIEPTQAAVARFFETGALPPFEVPGKYALVGYEEADLHRHVLVAVTRGRCERQRAWEDTHKFWVLFATEVFLEYGTYDILEPRDFVLGLLAVRVVCDEAERADLGDDLAALAMADPPPKRAFDLAQLAAVAALFAATDGRPGADALVERTFVLLEAAWNHLLGSMPSEHAENLATGGRLHFDADLYPEDASHWPADFTGERGLKSDDPGGYAQLLASMDAACLQALMRPRTFR